MYPDIKLQAKNLGKIYEDGTRALIDVSFEVAAGTIYAMLGANGAGKTTTINIFLNFISPTSGTALIDNINCTDQPLMAKAKVAYVSENVMLYANFTALQNLEFFAHIAGKNHYTRDDYVQVLNRVGLQEDAFNRKLKTFSKGMRQKCGIAIAILKDAPVIILDEPTSGLDPKAGYEFTTLLSSLKNEGKAIFMSTHDIFRARDIADKVGILNNGKLVMERSSEELKGQDLQELYVNHMAGYMDVAVSA